MVTYKMVEAAAKAMFEHGDHGAWGDRDTEFWKGYARAALEAALAASDAEPVAFRHRLIGSAIWNLSNEHEPNLNNARLFEKNFPGHLEIEPLYAAPPAVPDAEPVAWESTTVGYIKYVTDARYQKFSDEVKKWYKPYRCSSCAAPPAVAVKALEWLNDSSWNIAKSEIGRYVVRPCLATNFTGQWLLRRAGAEEEERGLYPSEEAAKVAAQADYEARIRAALLSPAATTVKMTCIEEGIERAARYIEKQRDEYVQKFGMHDPSTGVTEFSACALFSLSTLDELIDGIRTLAAAPKETGHE